MRAAAIALFGTFIGMLLLVGGRGVLAQAPAAAVDWFAYTAVEEVIAITSDEDGSSRETTVWLAVVDGEGYIRTGSTTWGDNAMRDPAFAIRVEGREVPVSVEFIEDEALRAQVIAAFRAKYGWTDGALNFIRGSRPKIMRLRAR